MYRGKGVENLGEGMSPYHHTVQKNLPNLPFGNLSKLQRSIVEKQVAAASTATTTRIGSLPVYPTSSDPGNAGRMSSSKSQMGRSLWLEQEWRLRISCTRSITGSCSRSRLKTSRAHRCIRRCIRVLRQNEHWLCQMLQVVFLCPTSSCHTALNSPTEIAGDAQIAARLTAQLFRSQPTWGLSFPYFLSNASNVGYFRFRRPACYHPRVLMIISLWQLAQF